MTRFWEFLSHSSPPSNRKLQDGLFQIASQTCNLLVQVNNTNNISYGHHATNIQLNNSLPSTPINRANGCTLSSTTDSEQLVVLIPPTENKINHKFKPGFFGKPRLSAVLEAPPVHNDEPDIWGPGGFLIQTDNDGSPMRRWGQKSKWCRPSCIPISIICILIFLVVLLPLLDHAAEKALLELNAPQNRFCNFCNLSLVESIPEGVVYNDSINFPSTFDTWIKLINTAKTSIDIASLYWTLRQSEVYPDASSVKGEAVFQSLLKAGLDRKINIRIAQNAPSQNFPNIDTELLVKRKAAEVRSLNFAKLLGEGVLHTKLWIIDKKHIYLGSANMDWRSLTQVKEMGIVIYNCSCLAKDISKIFDVYWYLGQDDAKVPNTWPDTYATKINMETPLNLSIGNDSFQTYFSSSPPPFNPLGRTNDINAILNVIKHAEKFIYIAVMDYFPLMIYSPKLKYWSFIDDALKAAAIEQHVKVKMLISWWNHSRPSEEHFLKSLASINKAYPMVSIEIRLFIVPSNKEQQKIPFARVNHNKYMVTDNTALIGTSNWSGDYFTNTAGISLILHDPIFDRSRNHTTIRSQLQSVFERDWNSNFSHSLTDIFI